MQSPRKPVPVPEMLPGERVYTRDEWLAVIDTIADAAEATERLSADELDDLERTAVRDRSRQ